MARRLVKIERKVCDRCMVGKEKPATQERIFAEENRYYKIDLCDDHAAAYDRERSQWTMLAEEIDSPYNNTGERPKSVFFTEERKREARRINELTDRVRREAAEREFAARRAAEIDAQELTEEIDRARKSIPGALKFRLTEHARARMVERGFTPWDVFSCAANPTHTGHPREGSGPTMRVLFRDDCRIVVDIANGGIVTVIERGAKVDDAPDATLSPTHHHPLERTAL